MDSDYIIYADESGDHGLPGGNPEYPVFVLALCIAKKGEYVANVVPEFLRFKFATFGHDMTVLHTREIKRTVGDFSLLTDAGAAKAFFAGLNGAIERSPFTVIAAAIDKQRFAKQYKTPDNPYDLALTFCLERAYRFLQDLGQGSRTTHFVIEARGKKEDGDLTDTFDSIVQGKNIHGQQFPFKLRICSKLVNSTGLQLADLVATPIGHRVLKPGQPNRAYEILEPKFRRSPEGKVSGWGLKVFPA